MNDLISVIVPIYNAESFLVRAIDSIIDQTYTNLEIILVDDGSPDNCPYICDEYAKMDHRIRVIHKENGGLSDARNMGLDMARGKYVVFFDDDDVLNKQFVEILYNICEINNCDIAQCDFLMTNDESILMPPQNNMRVKFFEPQETMKDFAIEANLVKYWVVWNKIYRRELFDDVRFPIGKNHEDMYTTYKLLWKSKKTAVTNLYLYYYFQRSTSMTGKKMSIEERIDVIEAIKIEMNFMKEKGLSNEYAFFLLKYYHTIIETNANIEEYFGYNTNLLYRKIIQDYMDETTALKKTILGLPQKGMLTKIRSIYPTLSQKEKNHFIKVYGNRVAQQFVNTYGFPYELIKKEDKVALYGAGNVGYSFYTQINENELCQLVAWVDNGFKNHIRKGLPVQPVDALLRCHFDKVIVAVQNRDTALEIRENLIGWGIDEKRIIVDLPIPVDKGSKMLEEFINETKLIKRGENQRRWILLNTPDHDNLGDHLLTMGTLKYLHDFFPDDEIIEITGRQWDACQDEIIPKITANDIISIVGGGYMGDLWPNQDSRVKEIIEVFKNNKIIFFPQTFYYFDNEESIIDDDIKLYNDNRNIYFIHRENNSYNSFVNRIVKEKKRNACFPDLALYLPKIKNEYKRKGILVCLRMDKESVSEDNRKDLLNLINGIGKEIKLIDTVLDRSVTKSDRIKEVNQMLDCIAKSELLITDRLHAMVMALITGTPCIVLDNLSRKVSGVYEWIRDNKYIKCVKADDVNYAMVQELLSIKTAEYNRQHVLKEFDDMHKCIIDWLGEK